MKALAPHMLQEQEKDVEKRESKCAQQNLKGMWQSGESNQLKENKHYLCNVGPQRNLYIQQTK